MTRLAAALHDPDRRPHPALEPRPALLPARRSFPTSVSLRPFLVRETAPDYGVEDDPFDDCDALENLEEEIVVLAAQIHAATHRLLTLIADFDRRRGWELGGHRSCAHWLHYRTGIDLGAAREKVRAARALEDLPLTSASMARGELSFSKDYAPYCTSLR